METLGIIILIALVANYFLRSVDKKTTPSYSSIELEKHIDIGPAQINDGPATNNDFLNIQQKLTFYFNNNNTNYTVSEGGRYLK